MVVLGKSSRDENLSSRERDGNMMIQMKQSDIWKIEGFLTMLGEILFQMDSVLWRHGKNAHPF